MRFVEAFKRFYADGMAAYATSKDPDFKHSILMGILFYGLNHAGTTNRSGLFSDLYRREGTIHNLLEFDVTTARSLFFQSSLAFTTKFHKENGIEEGSGFFIPVLNEKSAKWFISEHPNLKGKVELVKEKVGNKEVCFIKVNNTDLSDRETLDKRVIDVMKQLGKLGMLASVDTLVHVLASCHENFEYLVKNMLRLCHDVDLSQSLTPDTKSPRIITSIEGLIEKVPSIDIPERQFYFDGIWSVLNDIKRNKHDIPAEKRDAVLAAYNRIYELMESAAKDESLVDFDVSIELIFDEIIWLRELLGLDKDVSKRLKKDMLELINSAIETGESIRPKDLRVVGSGVLGFVILTTNIMKHLRAQGRKEVSIMSIQNTYFECQSLLGKQLSESANTVGVYSLESSKIRRDEGKHSEKRPYDVEADKVDVMVLATNSNINTELSGHASHDLIDLVAGEIKKHSVEDPLYVVIDETMSPFANTEFDLLLSRFSKEIEAGTMGVFVFRSLNKIYHCGTDKTCAGLIYGYYDINNPAFNALIKPEAQTVGSGLGEHSLDYVWMMGQHIYRKGETYFNMVIGNSRAIYEEVIIKESYNNKYVMIDDPFTKDVYKDPWPFLVVRIPPTAKIPNHEQNIIMESINRFLIDNNILPRDGFGFAETTSVLIADHVLRLSLGLNAKDCKLPELCKLVNIFNAICEAKDRLQRMRSHQIIEVTVPVELQPYVKAFIEQLQLTKIFTIVSPREPTAKMF